MLGEDDPDTLASVNDLGRVLHDCDGTWELEQQASDGDNDTPLCACESLIEFGSRAERGGMTGRWYYLQNNGNYVTI